MVWDLAYEWRDARLDAVAGRPHRRSTRPISVYEVHLGSWRRDPSDPQRFLGYAEVAEPLIATCSRPGSPTSSSSR